MLFLSAVGLSDDEGADVILVATRNMTIRFEQTFLFRPPIPQIHDSKKQSKFAFGVRPKTVQIKLFRVNSISLCQGIDRRIFGSQKAQ
jgi:hypothetical protein